MPYRISKYLSARLTGSLPAARVSLCPLEAISNAKTNVSE